MTLSADVPFIDCSTGKSAGWLENLRHGALRWREFEPQLDKLSGSIGLNILEADCPVDSRRDLGDLTIKALRQLHAAGIAATPNVILGAVMGMPDMGSRQECSTFFERYVARRRAGGPE